MNPVLLHLLSDLDRRQMCELLDWCWCKKERVSIRAVRLWRKSQHLGSEPAVIPALKAVEKDV